MVKNLMRWTFYYLIYNINFVQWTQMVKRLMSDNVYFNK